MTRAEESQTEETHPEKTAQKRNKRKIRFRFSLLTFLIIISLFGLGLGFYTQEIVPLREQWVVGRMVLERKGEIETHPPHLPGWIRSWLPEGEDKDIKTVSFQSDKWVSRQPNDEIIAGLSRLPYLQRLYLERSGISDRHIETIASLESVQRLSLWGNAIMEPASIQALAKMPNLRVIDLKENGLPWQELVPFGARPDIKVIVNRDVMELNESSEVELLARTGIHVEGVIFPAPDLETVFAAVDQMPDVRFIVVRDAKNLPADFVDVMAKHVLNQPVRRRPIAIFLNNEKQFGIRAVRVAAERFQSVVRAITVSNEGCFEELSDVPFLSWRYRYLIGMRGAAVILSLQQRPEQCMVEFRFELPDQTGVQTDEDLLAGLEQVSRLRVCDRDLAQGHRFYSILNRLEKVQHLELVTSGRAPGYLADLIDKVRGWNSIRKVSLLPIGQNYGLPDLEFLYGLDNLQEIELGAFSRERMKLSSNNRRVFRVKDISFVEKIPNLHTILVDGENRIAEFQNEFMTQREKQEFP